MMAAATPLAKLTPTLKRLDSGAKAENVGKVLSLVTPRSSRTVSFVAEVSDFPITVQVGNVFTHTCNVGTGDQNFKWLARVVCDALARESNMPVAAFHCVNLFDSTGCSLLPFDRIQDQCRPGDVLSLHLLPPTASGAPLTVNPFSSDAFAARGVKAVPPAAVFSPLPMVSSPTAAAPKSARGPAAASGLSFASPGLSLSLPLPLASPPAAFQTPRSVRYLVSVL